MAITTSYGQRVVELKHYLVFLRQIDRSSSKLQLGHGSKRRAAALDPELRKMLRANYFLIAYNLVESTVRDALGEVYRSIGSSGTTYVAIKPEWQKSIVKQRLRRALSSGRSHESIYEEVSALSLDIVRGSYTNFDLQDLPVSGNVDNVFIRDEICDRYGIEYRPAKSTRDGADLRVIKNLRNALAHGNVSFTEVGRDHVVRELAEMSGRVALYMNAFTRCADRYVATAGFVTKA